MDSFVAVCTDWLRRDDQHDGAARQSLADLALQPLVRRVINLLLAWGPLKLLVATAVNALAGYLGLNDLLLDSNGDFVEFERHFNNYGVVLCAC